MFNFFRKRKSEDDLLGPAVRVMSGSISVDFDFANYAEKNIFNQLSQSSDYGFYYWPYGYLFRHMKWGGVNSLGFRIDTELEDISEAYGDVFRIAFLGCSTGFDVLVPKEETLVYQLEQLLNEDEQVCERIGKKIKIFNLSQPGNLVLNQISNFVQFGHLIDPHLVICHSAANDLCTMQMNDPALVNSYCIGYPDVLEAWGKKIHNAENVDIDYQYSDHNQPNFRPAKDRVSPSSIVDAYTFRVHQFNRLTKSLDVETFIAGFQPWITSKAELSAEEQKRRVSYNPYYQTIYKNVEHLYQSFSDEILRKLEPLNVANLHSHFSTLSSDIDHFGDTHHLLREGNHEAACCYHKAVRTTLLQ